MSLRSVGSASQRQLIKMDKIDVCAILTGLNSFPFFKVCYDYYIFLFPNLPRICPVQPAKYYQPNITVVFDVEGQGVATGFYGILDAMSPLPLPNGVYRNTVHVYNRRYGSLGGLYFDIEIYDPMNSNKFWEEFSRKKKWIWCAAWNHRNLGNLSNLISLNSKRWSFSVYWYDATFQYHNNSKHSNFPI